MIDAALIARARGAGADLMSHEALIFLDRAADLSELGARLATAGYLVDREHTTLEVIDRAVARRASDELALLWRWHPARAGVIAVLVDELDARNLRVIIRGLAGHVSAARRIAAVVPTPTLPRDTLGELATCSTIAALADVLVRRAHPYANAIADAGGDTPIDVLAIEAAIARRFAARARGLRGDRAARTFVGQCLDLHNAVAALQLAERGAELDPDDYLVPGGRRRAVAIAAAHATVDTARRLLSQVFARTPIAAPIAVGEPHAIEQATLKWQLATQATLRRLDPLGSATILHLMLARRSEVRRARRAAWRLALAGRS